MKKAFGVLVLLFLTLIVCVGSTLAAEQVFIYHTDSVGTPQAMTDSTGKVVWKADYKPFGEEQSVTATTNNGRRFIGKEKDEETGLSYFGARYMDARSGRFLAVDPERAVDRGSGRTDEELLLNPQRLNTYAYGLNNPYRYIDPDGKAAILVPFLLNLFLPNSANAPEYPNTPTVPSQAAIQFAFEAALLETGGRVTGDLIGLVGKEVTPIARSLGAAAAREAKVLQTGGHTLSRHALKELRLIKEQGKTAMEKYFIRKLEKSWAIYTTMYREAFMNPVYGDIGDLFGENTACKKTNVTFRIGGDTLDPNEVTYSLRIEPTRAFAKGEEYYIKKIGEVRFRPIGHWSISSEGFVDSTSTEAHARYLLNILEPSIDVIAKYLNNPCCRTSIIFWWEATDEHGGFTLKSDTLSRLCRLCNDLDYIFIG